MNAITLVQGSPEWFAARIGKVTASRVADAIAKTKSGWGAGRKNYAAELIAERLTRTPAQSYTNTAMQWGIDTEPQARGAYEFFRDAKVVEVGFVTHPTINMSGASPDGTSVTSATVQQSGVLRSYCTTLAAIPLAPHMDEMIVAAAPTWIHTPAASIEILS